MPTTRCPACKQLLTVRDDYLGIRVRCPACSSEMVIPALVAVAPGTAGRPRTVSQVTASVQPAPTSRAKICPHCGGKMRLADQDGGARLVCPICKRRPDPAAAEQVLTVMGDEENDDCDSPARAGTAPRRPAPGEPTVQCYDCRYPVVVDDSMSMLVNTGHSEGRFSGTAAGIGMSRGGPGLGVGKFGGNSTAAHFGKVDLCKPCCEARLVKLWRRIRPLQVFGLTTLVAFGVPAFFVAASKGAGIIGYSVAFFVSTIIPAAIVKPLPFLMEQVRSAVPNGRRRPLRT